MRGSPLRRVLSASLKLGVAGLLALGGVACDSYDDDGAGQPGDGEQEQPEGDGGY